MGCSEGVPGRHGTGSIAAAARFDIQARRTETKTPKLKSRQLLMNSIQKWLRMSSFILMSATIPTRPINYDMHKCDLQLISCSPHLFAQLNTLLMLGFALGTFPITMRKRCCRVAHKGRPTKFSTVELATSLAVRRSAWKQNSHNSETTLGYVGVGATPGDVPKCHPPTMVQQLGH